MQDRCIVCVEHNIGSEIIYDTWGIVKSHFGPFGDSISVGARWEHGLRRTYQKLRNYFGHTRWVLLGDEAQVEGLPVRLEIVLILIQVSCIVCAKRTKGSEIILDAANNTPR
jgi:hypothetical protein